MYIWRAVESLVSAMYTYFVAFFALITVQTKMGEQYSCTINTFAVNPWEILI